MLYRSNVGRQFAFITGSHAYGEPHDKSDVDVVIPATLWLCRELVDKLDLDEQADYQNDVQQLKVLDDKLNLIFVDQREWHAWWEGTQLLIAEKPATRARACEVIQGLLKEKRNMGNPMTAYEFAGLDAQQRGWSVYMHGHRIEEPNIPNELNPYMEGGDDHGAWKRGHLAAMQTAQANE